MQTTFVIKFIRRNKGEENDIRKVTFKHIPNMDNIKEILQKMFLDIDINEYYLKYIDEEKDYITSMYFLISH